MKDTGGKTYVPYPSSKVPKFQVKSLSLLATSVRTSFTTLTGSARLDEYIFH